MSRITVIGEVKVKVVGGGYRELTREVKTSATTESLCGGMAQSVAMAAAEAGHEAILISAAGNDFVGRAMKEELKAKGVNVDRLTLLDDVATNVEIFLLNIIGDLDFQIANDNVPAAISINTIKEALDVINGSDVVAVDGGLSRETLEYIADNVTAPVFLDPGSVEDAEKIKDIIGKFDAIKPNRAEASIMCGDEIFSEDQLRSACKWFQDKGVKTVFVTMSGGGVFYNDGEKDGFIRPEEVLTFVHKDGAGDAFSAAIAVGMAEAKGVEEIAADGMTAAGKVMETKRNYSPARLLDEEEK